MRHFYCIERLLRRTQIAPLKLRKYCSTVESGSDDFLSKTALYLRGKYALQKRAVVLPFFDLEQIVAHLSDIQYSVNQRKLDINVLPLKQGLASWKVVRKELARLEDLEKAKKQELKASDEVNSPLLKAELSQIHGYLKDVKYDLSRLDKKVIPILLQMPNMIFQNKQLEAHCKVYKEPRNISAPKCHVELAKTKLQFMDNTLCYLLDDLAHLEDKITSLFTEAFSCDSRIPVETPDFALDTVVEACATGNQIIVDEKNKHGGHVLHLTGGASLEAFGCFLTRRRVNRFPLECYTTGRFYRNPVDDAKLDGLRTLSQSTRNAIFVANDTPLSIEHLENILKTLNGLYDKFEIPYKFRMAGPTDLSQVECMRIDIEVWSPPKQKYTSVGFLALHGDFLACRLNMCSKVRPLHTVYGCAVDVQALIAGLLENFQDKDGTYTLPDLLKP